MMRLETERLYLRPIRAEDKTALFAYRSDAVANQYQDWIPECLEDVAVFIGRLASKPDVPDTWFQLAIVEKESDAVIGDIGLHFLRGDNRQVEIGYTLIPAFQKKGYATEAVKKIIHYLFKDLNKHRIIASIDPDNADSIRLIERLGFRKEAHFVQSLFLNGKWVDDVIYAMLAKEWDKMGK